MTAVHVIASHRLRRPIRQSARPRCRTTERGRCGRGPEARLNRRGGPSLPLPHLERQSLRRSRPCRSSPRRHLLSSAMP